MKRQAFTMVLTLALATILSACSGSNKPSTSINVTMTDFAYSPNVFTVPAGQQISFHAQNNGAVAHSFIIMQAGHEVHDHFTPADQAFVFWQQAEVDPGQSVQASFSAPAQPGTYQIVCGNGGHFEAGMVAKLIVVAQQ